MSQEGTQLTRKLVVAVRGDPRDRSECTGVISMSVETLSTTGRFASTEPSHSPLIIRGSVASDSSSAHFLITPCSERRMSNGRTYTMIEYAHRTNSHNTRPVASGPPHAVITIRSFKPPWTWLKRRQNRPSEGRFSGTPTIAVGVSVVGCENVE